MCNYISFESQNLITHFLKFHLKQVIYVIIHMNAQNNPGVLFVFTQVSFSTGELVKNRDSLHQL